MFAAKLKYGCVAVVLFCQSAALAQLVPDCHGAPAEVMYQPASPLPPDPHFAYHHASICPEQARLLALDNQRRALEHRVWLMAWQELDLQRRLEAMRLEKEARWFSAFGVYLLRPDEVNRVTGQIAWPHLLQSIEFQPLREQLDTLFALRVRYPAATAEAEIDHCVERLIWELQRRIGFVDRHEYLAAQDFLRGLKYESELGT